MRILTAKRHETMGNLAIEFDVSIRTIRTDVTILTKDHPIETIRGNGGCVKLSDGYYPNRNILSQRHQKVLMQIQDKVDEYEREVLQEILEAFGSPSIRKKLA